MKIYGVGAHVANQWYKEGMRTLDDIRKRSDLTEAQRKGLQYFDDMQVRIPRSEVMVYQNRYAVILNRIQTLLHEMDMNLEGQVLGSFRRGVENCGDVDVLS